MMKVLQQVSIQNKKKLQQAFLSLIVLNLSLQCILPGNNAKSSNYHLIKTIHKREFQFSISTKSKDAQISQIICFLKCV